MNISFRKICFIALVFLAPATAEAHSDLRLGPFGAGILHPVETLPHLLTLLALGLLLGRRPPFRLWPLFGIFAPVAAAALLITLADHAAPVPAWLTSGFAVVLGIALVSRRNTAPREDAFLLAMAALVLGLDSGFANPSALMVGKVLFGNWVSFLVLIGYVAFYSSLLPPRPWTPRVFRVAGSWIVAAGLLALVLSLRQP